MSTDYENLNELRSVMFKKFPHLSNISLVPQNNIAKLKKTRNTKLSKDFINSSMKTFYMTDSVSRNSPTMSSCSSQIKR